MSSEQIENLKIHFLTTKQFNDKQSPAANELWLTKLPHWIGYTSGSCLGITTQPTASGNEIDFYAGASFVVCCGKYADGTLKNQIVYIDSDKYATVSAGGSYCFDENGNMLTGTITYNETTNLVSVNGTAGHYTKAIQNYTYSDGVVTLEGTIQPDVMTFNAEALVNAHNSSSTAHSTYLQSKITGAATTITGSNLTASRVLVSNTSGKVAVSSISTTKLGYLTDVTSNIQAQLNGKQASLPSQSGNSGKYLTTNGSALSWGTITIPTVNDSTITIQKNSTDIDSFTLNQSSGKTINISVPTDTNDLTNGAGFITGITSSDVTTALGYTPYNSSNPSGYITSSDVQAYTAAEVETLWESIA